MPSPDAAGAAIEVPVCYGGDLGPDLAGVAARDLHSGDVDTGLTEDAAHRADDSGTVDVAEDDHVIGEGEVHGCLGLTGSDQHSPFPGTKREDHVPGATPAGLPWRRPQIHTRPRSGSSGPGCSASTANSSDLPVPAPPTKIPP